MILTGGFYREIVKPLLEGSFPGLRYSAALMGYGSDVLGMDTERSTDHNWGPRMQIFVDDKAVIGRLDKRLREALPVKYRGYSVNFSDRRDHETQSMAEAETGPVNCLIEISRFEDYLKDKYSIARTSGFSLRDWLSFTDRRLLEITSGEVFFDGLEKANRTRKELNFYPPDICKLRLAVLWHYISNKEAFVGRCVELNDFAGLKIISGRLANYLIKILFYLEKKYIPYSKWFGSFFKKLECYERARAAAESALAENDPEKISEALCRLYVFVVEKHNAAAGTLCAASSCLYIF